MQVFGSLYGLATETLARGSEEEQVINDHSDSEYDSGVINRLVELDNHVQPICSDLKDVWSVLQATVTDLLML